MLSKSRYKSGRWGTSWGDYLNKSSVSHQNNTCHKVLSLTMSLKWASEIFGPMGSRRHVDAGGDPLGYSTQLKHFPKHLSIYSSNSPKVEEHDRHIVPPLTGERFCDVYSAFFVVSKGMEGRRGILYPTHQMHPSKIQDADPKCNSDSNLTQRFDLSRFHLDLLVKKKCHR